MNSEKATKSGRGRGRGSRGARGARGGKGRGRGRGKKAVVIESSDEELQDEAIDEPILEEETKVRVASPEPPKIAEIYTTGNLEKENEPESNIPPPIDMEADISQLEAPTFTTIQRGPPEPMLHLKWDHKVTLIGEKVLNPMIHCCDQCLKPILIYGRMIPCKHVFCLKCARSEPVKLCPRCKEKVCRVEQSGLGSVFMCTHGGTRYGNAGCRRTYLSQRDLQAHINHRHVDNTPKQAAIDVAKSSLPPQPVPPPRKQSMDLQTTLPRGGNTLTSNIRGSSGSATGNTFASSSSSTSSNLSSRTNLITVPIQDAQQSSIPQIVNAGSQHNPSELSSSGYYNSSLQVSYGSSNSTFGSPQFSSISTISQSKAAITPPTQQIHNLGISRTSGNQQQSSSSFYQSQHYSQHQQQQQTYNPIQTHYHQSNYGSGGGGTGGNNQSGNNPNNSSAQSSNQSWNQQQYYR